MLDEAGPNEQVMLDEACLHSVGLYSEGLRSWATDFGSEKIPTRSGGLHSGGLLSRATDFGSGIAFTCS